MSINYTATPQSLRLQMEMGGLTRFTSVTHAIKQAARNGQRRANA